MIYIETGSTDVYYNFGLENYFATEKRLPDTVFLFWRTTPTLMVGKYQNILEEINKPYADAHGIHLVRRMSGGGRSTPISAAGSSGSLSTRRSSRLNSRSISVPSWTPCASWARMPASMAATIC